MYVTTRLPLLFMCALPWAWLAGGGIAHAEPAQLPIKTASLQEKIVATSSSIAREASKRGFKHWLRSKVYSPEVDARYGLQLTTGWEQTAQDRPMVVLLHGYNSSLEKNTELLSVIRNHGFPCAGFAYPNDFHIADSAQRLSRELQAFKQLHNNRRLTLITHSMGGLVARECLENKRLDPGNVDRLIMIAPPTQGTLLAQVAVATDVWEHWLGRKTGGPWSRWRDSVADGLGEAADDLVPGSPFLQKLNSRPRNSKVAYTIFLGTGAGVAQEEMDWLRAKLLATAEYLPGTHSAAEQCDQILSEMEELVDGKGDGIVAVKRGRLQGVEDVVILPFGHLAVTGKAEDHVVRKVQKEVLRRLQ